MTGISNFANFENFVRFGIVSSGVNQKLELILIHNLAYFKVLRI